MAFGVLFCFLTFLFLLPVQRDSWRRNPAAINAAFFYGKRPLVADRMMGSDIGAAAEAAEFEADPFNVLAERIVFKRVMLMMAANCIQQ